MKKYHLTSTDALIFVIFNGSLEETSPAAGMRVQKTKWYQFNICYINAFAIDIINPC